MLEKYLRILIICVCVFGLLGLLLITSFYNARRITVNELLLNPPNESIYLVDGRIKNPQIKSNTLFFELCDFSCIACVYFNPSFGLEGGKEISVKAKYTTFNNKPELIVYSFEERWCYS